MRVVISAGHGKYVRGASGYLDEVDEARRVVAETAQFLTDQSVSVMTYWDDVSRTQAENLRRIVDFHNSKTRDLDISIHFNANETTDKPRGTEVLYVSQTGFEHADEVVDAIALASGLTNRGPKKRENLYFLNNTEEPAILIEVCFVDSSTDAEIYRAKFSAICEAIARSISGEDTGDAVTPLFRATGKCSTFGGPEDTGVAPEEGLGFITGFMQVPYLFLPYQPSGTTGLARRLNPHVHYVACRWDYAKTPREMLREEVAWVRNIETGRGMTAFPADWGPNENTGRVADLSPGLAKDLVLETDQEVEVIFPYREG